MVNYQCICKKSSVGFRRIRGYTNFTFYLKSTVNKINNRITTQLSLFKKDFNFLLLTVKATKIAWIHSNYEEYIN